MTHGALMENPTDLFGKLDNHNDSDPFENISGGDNSDSFTNSADDLFNMVSGGRSADQSSHSHSSGGFDTEALLQEAMNKSGGSITLDFLKDNDDDVNMDSMESPLFQKTSIFDKSLDISKAVTNPNTLSGFWGPSNSNSNGNTQDSSMAEESLWGTGTNSASGTSTPQKSALEAAPLNLSLGSGGGIASMLRRKSSNSQLQTNKFGAIHKTSKTSSKLRSNKSDGLLARALKQRYNSGGNNLNQWGSSGADASITISRNAVSAYGDTFGDDVDPSEDLAAVEKEPGSGAQNASWGGSRPAGGESPFSQYLSANTTGKKKNLVSSSTSDLMRRAKLNSGPQSSSRSSFQDMLRLSKKQSKTQSALRQSSAQSLRKNAGSKSFSGGSANISSLLPPQHAAAYVNAFGSGTLGSAAFVGGGTTQNFSFNTSSQPQAIAAPAASNDAASLLHQSCRLYPTTAAVVESALRIDPEAARKPITPIVEKGLQNKAQNTYGYPINIALSRHGSLEVIKMLAEAAPEVLLEKDGKDGSGALGIAIMSKCEWKVIHLLLRTNIECIKVADRRGNYPLHVAANHGISLGVVRKLYKLYPMALQMRNFHSETPLDIAQRSTRCSEDVMNFLQSAAFSTLESTATHMESLDDIMETNL